jgi:putative tryptophan/tyrosine transport system substrate-binding protein
LPTLRHSGRVVVCLAFLLFIAPMWARAADVVVVKSKELSVYEKAIAGFKQQYKGSLSVLTMKDDLNDPGKLAARVKSESPKAILAVGLRAARALKSEITGIPIVFCMAMNPVQSKLRSSNATGVDLEPRPREQLLAFKEALPTIQKIGIIYDPKRTGPFVDAVAKAAPEAGVGLIAVRVKEKKDVPAALKEVIKKADAIWLIRDATVMSREFFNHTLIVQFEKKIPLLAYSPMFVRKQAVCSFAASYSDQGRKAAEVVMMILGGTSPGDIPIQAPTGTLTINLNSAAKAGVKVPPSVLNKPGVEKVGK